MVSLFCYSYFFEFRSVRSWNIVGVHLTIILLSHTLFVFVVCPLFFFLFVNYNASGSQDLSLGALP